MKKILTAALLIVLTVLLAACSGSKGYGENLLTNGSFEENTGSSVEGWALERYDVSAPVSYYGAEKSANAPDGSNVLKIESPEYNDARYIQEVKVKPDSYYKLTAKVKTGAISQRSAESGANICFLQTYCKSEYVKADKDWQEITVYGRTDSKTKKVTVALRLGYYSADCAGEVYFDDVSLERVEELPEGITATSMTEFSFSSSSESEEDSTSKLNKGKIIANSVLSGVFSFAAVALFAIWIVKGLKLKKRDGYVLIAVALVVKLIAASMYVGFKVDINCFSAWGNIMFENGIFKFYSEDLFCDYPPLYMIVLGIVRGIAELFKLQFSEGAGLVLLKTPAILADIMAAVLIMEYARKRTDEKIAVAMGVAYAFLPTALLNSSLWGQVDSVLVLFMLITFMLIDDDKFGLSVLTYFVGLLFKPQALLFGPVMLLAAVREFVVIGNAFKNGNKKDGGIRLIKGFGYLGASVAIFAIIGAVMRNDQDPNWLIEKYVSTVNSYQYATLSSFGLMGLLGGQWQACEKAIGETSLTYGELGKVLLVLVIAATAVIFVLKLLKSKDKVVPTRWMWLLASFMLAGSVVVSTMTHERYMFPAIAMLLISGLLFKDKRLIICSVGYGVLNFINTACVLFLYETHGVYMEADDGIFIVGSLLTVLLFLYQAFVTVNLLINDEKIKEAPLKEKAPVRTGTALSSGTSKLNDLLARRQYKLPKVTWKDIVICLLITAVYASIAFTNLGDTESPDSYWYTGQGDVYAVADLGEKKDFDNIAYLSSSISGSAEIYLSDDGENYERYATVTANSITAGSWNEVGEKASARYIKIAAQAAITIEEMVVLKDGAPLEIASADQNVAIVDKAKGQASKLFDEQDLYLKDLNSVPETEWTNGGKYIVSFEKPINIDDVMTYVTYTEAGNDLVISVPGAVAGKETAWENAIEFFSDDNISGWVSANFMLEPSTLVNVDKVLVECIDATRVSEIAFLTGGEIGKISSITDEAGNKVDASNEINNCFDEQDKVSLARRQSSPWRITSVNDYVIIDFGEVKNLNRGYYFTSLCKGSFSVYYSVDGETWSNKKSYTVEESQLYYWHSLGSIDGTEARYVLVQATNRFMSLLEMGFFDSAEAESPIAIKEIISYSTSDENGAECLFDEQELVPYEGATYMNSMYFDEIYHARTAYESATGHSIYEVTHPPLGKDMMSWCVSIMGMNPFAWRFAGTVAGILMIPAIYFLGFLIFRKTSWATVLALLMAFDGMHYVQTRIATIDSYGVLFIILMFLFMYWYYSISFYDQPLWKTFIPLGLCGLSFGLGAASKWICLYAGAGLAVLFFITLFRRFMEYRLSLKAIAGATGETKQYLKKIQDTFVNNTCYTILFCILMFIIVPLTIYCLSYYPYWNAVGETRPWYQIIIDNQEYMFSYHSKLEATHPYMSDWYTWPVMQKPMFYYTGPSTDTTVSAIYAFGNPAVWYAGLVCTILAAIIFLKRFFGGKVAAQSGDGMLVKLFGTGEDGLNDVNERDTRTLMFLFIGLASNLLPWVGISRCVFIYHYFASVPFIMMFTVYILRNIGRKRTIVAVILTALLLVLTVVLFFMFLPLWTGTPVDLTYLREWLMWFPSWFAYYA